MRLKTRNWLLGFFIIVFVLLFAIIGLVAYIDPFFHYHKPHTDMFYYQLGNERSINDGIAKHFDYDAIVTGTSMAQNFKTSDIDRIFKVSSVKLPFSGGSYNEINDCLKVALKSNGQKVKIIVRGLDMSMFFQNKDTMRFDLGTYPTYLYDNNTETKFSDAKNQR